jgi:uncharacterized protein (TIGR04141 family)
MSPVQTVSIYLLKPGIGDGRDALRDGPAGLTTHRLTVPNAEGTVFAAPVSEHEPEWVRLLRPVTEPPVELRSRSASAVLVLQTAGRWFAVAFGRGWTLLDPSCYVRRFGLRAALNAVDPAQLRRAQARTFNDYALQTQRQVGRLSRVEALELDVERDLVTALGGTLVDETLGRRLDGRDAARLTAELHAAALPGKCAELLRQSIGVGYRDAYPWIDTIEEVTDPEEIAALEGRAGDLLGQRSFAAFDLFPPEVVSEEVVSYRLRPSDGGRVVIEPDASLLGLAVRVPMSGEHARAAVQRHRLIGLDAGGEVVARWSFWDCLTVELLHDGRRVVLDDGRWYRVDRAFAEQVDTFVASLRSSGLALPAAIRDEAEEAYNARAAAALGAALLDQKLIKLPGRTAVEPCDLFTTSGQLVHVKRRKGGSAPMSHLIAQAAVSADLLLSERRFRDELRDELDRDGHGLATRVGEPACAADHSLVLGLITNLAATGDVGARLPFFTKVFLRQNVRRLQAMGFTVHLDEIAVTLPQVTRTRPRPTRRRTPAAAQRVRR